MTVIRNTVIFSIVEIPQVIYLIIMQSCNVFTLESIKSTFFQSVSKVK